MRVYDASLPERRTHLLPRALIEETIFRTKNKNATGSCVRLNVPWFPVRRERRFMVHSRHAGRAHSPETLSGGDRGGGALREGSTVLIPYGVNIQYGAHRHDRFSTGSMMISTLSEEY